MKANRLRLPGAGLAQWRRKAQPDARLLARILTALALVALAWAIAQLLATLLGWRSSQPALALTAPVAEDSGAARRTLGRWFSAGSADAPAQETALSKLQLIAVIAGRNGVALIGGLEDRPRAIQVGTFASQDLKLVEVRPDRAVFEQSGRRVELPFPLPGNPDLFSAPASAPASSIAPVAVAAPAPAAEAASAPASEASVSRGRLTAIAQNTNLGAWDKGLANFASGGIQITSASEQPLAGVLALRDGDIIRQVNNREIKQLADISLVYHYFSQSQDVNLQILRDGKPMQINFKITP